MNGKEAYNYVSGRESFYEDLLKTTNYVFSNYKSYGTFIQDIQECFAQRNKPI